MRSGFFGGIEAITYQLTMTSSGLKEYIWYKLIYSIVVGLLSDLKAEKEAEKEDRRKRFIQITICCFLFQIWKYWIITFQQSETNEMRFKTNEMRFKTNEMRFKTNEMRFKTNEMRLKISRLNSSITRVLAVALVGGLLHPVSPDEGFILQGFKYFLYYENN
jgi:hypothetical protein